MSRPGIIFISYVRVITTVLLFSSWAYYQKVSAKKVSAINGGWTKWSSWSAPLVACGTFKSFRTRTCTNPQPKHGGKLCPGSRKQTKSRTHEVVPKCPDPPQTPIMTGLDRPIGVDTNHKLTCDAYANKTHGNSQGSITYTWYKDKKVKATGSTLLFIPIAKTDAGTYRCEAKNIIGTTTTTQDTDLEVYYPPVIIKITSTKSTRVLNQQETFTCIISGGNPSNQTLIIYREKDGRQQIMKGTGPTTVLKNRTMVKDDNDAKFYCESSLSGYQNVSKKSAEITYVVYYPHSVTMFTNTSTNVEAGTTVTIICNATGGNPPTVKRYDWTKNGRRLWSSSRVYQEHQLNESGLYACTATNDGGSASKSIMITVNSMVADPTIFYIVGVTIPGGVLIIAIVAVLIILKKRKAHVFAPTRNLKRPTESSKLPGVESPPICVVEVENPVYAGVYEEIGPSCRLGCDTEAAVEEIYVEPNAEWNQQDDQPMYVNIGPGRFQSGDNETTDNSESSNVNANVYASLEQCKMAMRQPDIYEILEAGQKNKET